MCLTLLLGNVVCECVYTVEILGTVNKQHAMIGN